MSGYKDHTHRSGKKKNKKKFNSPIHPSESERDAGKEGGEGSGQSESVCTFCVTTASLQLDVITYDSHAVQINSQEQNEKKKKNNWTFINRGLHLRAMWPHVLVRSCTATAEKKNKKKQKNRLPPHQLKCDCMLHSSSSDQRDHSGPNVHQ